MELIYPRKIVELVRPLDVSDAPLARYGLRFRYYHEGGSMSGSLAQELCYVLYRAPRLFGYEFRSPSAD